MNGVWFNVSNAEQNEDLIRTLAELFILQSKEGDDAIPNEDLYICTTGRRCVGG